MKALSSSSGVTVHPAPLDSNLQAPLPAFEQFYQTTSPTLPRVYGIRGKNRNLFWGHRPVSQNLSLSTLYALFSSLSRAQTQHHRPLEHYAEGCRQLCLPWSLQGVYCEWFTERKHFFEGNLWRELGVRLTLIQMHAASRKRHVALLLVQETMERASTGSRRYLSPTFYRRQLRELTFTGFACDENPLVKIRLSLDAI